MTDTLRDSLQQIASNPPVCDVSLGITAAEALAEIERLEAEVASLKTTRKIAPVQGYAPGIPWSMHLRAYAAYSKEYRPQPALIEGGCRGGFHADELDGFIPGWRDELSEIKALQADNARLRAALSELVAVYKARESDYVQQQDWKDRESYLRREGSAWQAARLALQPHKENNNGT